MEFQYKEDMKEYFEDGILCRGLDKFSMDYKEFLEIVNTRHTIFMDNFTSGHFDLPLSDIVSFNVKQVAPWNGLLTVLCEDLNEFFKERTTVAILAGTEN